MSHDIICKKCKTPFVGGGSGWEQDPDGSLFCPKCMEEIHLEEENEFVRQEIPEELLEDEEL